MVTNYRITHHTGHDIIEYQVGPNELSAIRGIGFSSRPAKGFDVNYYAFARDAYRGDRLDKLVRYLRSSYKPLQVTISCFTGDTGTNSATVGRDDPQDICASIGKQMLQVGLPISTRRSSIEVTLERLVLSERLVIEALASYHVRTDIFGRPCVLADLVYHNYTDGLKISDAELMTTCAESREAARQVEDFKTRTTQDILDLLSQPLARIAEHQYHAPRFAPEPMLPAEAGFETWNLLHEFDTSLLLGSRLETNLARALEQDDPAGLHSVPVDIDTCVLFPSEVNASRYNIPKGWQPIISFVQRKLQLFSPGHRLVVHPIPYNLGDMAQAVAECRNLVREGHPRLTLLFSPPEWARDSDDPLWSMADVKTAELKAELRAMGQADFLVTLNWFLAGPGMDMEPVVTSALLKGLFVLGCQHWTVARMPLKFYHPGQVAFIGLDAASKPARMAGTIFDSEGRWLGYYRLPCAGRGEYATAEEVRTILIRLLGHYAKMKGSIPWHIIIHRDGRWGEQEREGVRSLSSERNFSFDLLEVTKSGSPRLCQAGNQGGTPSAGLAVGSEDKGLAYLITSHTVQERGVWPSPNALQVRKLDGITPLKTLVAQVYWLSKMDIGSYHHTTNLPVTTAYADTLANWGHRLGSPWGSEVDPPRKIPYFM